MRPSGYRPVTQVSMLVTVLLLCLEVDSEDCSLTIKIRRNTTYKAVVERRLGIQCPVEFCNNTPPNITWTKHNVIITNNDTHIDTKWEGTEHSKGIAHLIFHKVLLSDSGSYQCKAEDDVSHVITVTVSDTEYEAVTLPGTINVTQSQQPATDTLWLYVYCAGGTMMLVILVIAVMVLALQCCKGKFRKQKQSESPYTEIPMSQQPILPHNPPQPGGPDHIYDNTPYQAKVSANRMTSLGDQGSGNEEQTRGRDNTKADINSHGEITYASLNHQALPPGRAVRLPRPKEECSDYAAIRCVS